ncbi:MAG: DUF2797 domain-containing protein [Bacteroidales bacterium]|nr:DUF2797 domain-containing protein [Bacteroidales bacterium]
MKEYSGILQKMETTLNQQVEYSLQLNEQIINMNELIGKPITLGWSGEIHCLHCGRLTETSYFQGYCYPCFKTLPQTDDCIFNPELCKAHEGISRDRRFAEQFCLQDHYVYLALTDSVKVGVTRATQVPTRWIDQGAWKAIRLAKTPNRFLAGIIEVELKNILKDKTNWRNMLTNKKDESVDLMREKERALSYLSASSSKFYDDNHEITEIQYPVAAYPLKVNYTNLEKSREVSRTLIGIRGQYLLFDNGDSLNIRKYGGYSITLKYN